MNKKTLVIGASPNPDRYAYHAVERLRSAGHEVIPLGIKKGEIAGISIEQGFPTIDDLHTITLYINPHLQEGYYDYVLKAQPKRLIFNPGTENPTFAEKARREGIEVVIACTLVMLSIGAF